MLAVASFALGLNIGSAPATVARVPTASMMVKPLEEKLYKKQGPLGTKFAENMGDSASFIMEAGKVVPTKPRIRPQTPKSMFGSFLDDRTGAGVEQGGAREWSDPSEKVLGSI